jgi:hypothetical protein
MKGILVALALLQLVLLSEGWPKTRRIGWDSKLSTKLTRICPLNPKLAAWKKALRLALKRDRGKRELAVSKYLIIDKIRTMKNTLNIAFVRSAQKLG